MNLSDNYLNLMVQAGQASNRKEAIDLINKATKLREQMSLQSCNTCGAEFVSLDGRKLQQPCCYCRNESFSDQVHKIKLNDDQSAHAEFHQLRKDLY